MTLQCRLNIIKIISVMKVSATFILTSKTTVKKELVLYSHDFTLSL